MGLLQNQTQSAYYTGSTFGDYQYKSIEDIINAFELSYVGEDKIISRVSRSDIQYHAMRAIQEFNYDTLRSKKTQEIELPATLTMILPQDFVNYVKFTWVDSSGIEHIIYPIRITSNPQNITQNTDGSYDFGGGTSLQYDATSDTQSNFSSIAQSTDANVYDNNRTWPHQGGRFGLDPELSNSNGNFYIDYVSGKVFFSSDIAGRTIILEYISDGLGEDGDMVIHKMAEEAAYKWIAYAIMSTRANADPNVVNRLKKERYAELRKAKLRLSNIKLEEISQVLRGRSKWIKH